MRVLIRSDEGLFVAQCLEHDICVQGADVDQLKDRLEKTIELERAARGGTLDGIAPAPEAFHNIWNQSQGLGGDPTGFEVRLVA